MPGGCTRDLVHEFYQEQYQLNDGAQNRYATGSDSAGTTMGVYDTRSLPIYEYLHAEASPALRDRRQLLPGGVRRLVPQPPVADRRCGRRSYPNAPAALALARGLERAAGGTTIRSTTPTGPRDLRRRRLHAVPVRHRSRARVRRLRREHDAADRTSRSARFGDKLVRADRRDDRRPAERGRASRGRGTPAAGTNAAGDTAGRAGRTEPRRATCTGSRTRRPNPAYPYPKCPNYAFQFHHQPFELLRELRPGRARSRAPARRGGVRESLRPLVDASVRTSTSVSFVKPIGQENEHPGYASEPNGSTHLDRAASADPRTVRAPKDTMVDRHVRRVRRPVGSRLAAGSG